jgi:transposase
MATDKKNARRLAAYIVFVDESGFLIIPPISRTWAPRGCTPIHHHLHRHDRISVVSGISVSPTRRRVGLYYQLHRKNIQQLDTCSFIRELLLHLRGRLIVLWDNGSIHGGESIRLLCRRYAGRLWFERFPAYAPELNPDEGVWRIAKRTLANGRPENAIDLAVHLIDTLENVRRSPHLLRSCIRHARLPSFCL